MHFYNVYKYVPFSPFQYYRIVVETTFLEIVRGVYS